MTLKTRTYLGLPSRIRTILILSEGWLVGKAIEQILDGSAPKDYDIIVPDRQKFHNTINHLLAYSSPKFNSWGGLKFDDVDIWNEELDHFIKNCSYKSWVYNLSKSVLLKNEE